MRRSLAVALVALSGIVVQERALAGRFPEWASAAAAGIDLEKYTAEDAVVGLDEWRISLRDGVRTGTRRRVLRILTHDGAGLASVAINTDSFRQIKRVRVWALDPDGSIRRYSDEDGTLAGTSSTRYLDDSEMLTVDPPRARPGMVVAMEYEFRRTADHMQDLIPIQQQIPVEVHRIEVEPRRDWSVRSRVSQGHNPGPAEAFETAVWEIHDVPASKPLEQEGVPQPPVLTLALNYVPPGGTSPFDSWNSTARWVSTLFELDRGESGYAPPLSGDPDVDALTLAGARARNLRYFAVNLGWGGWIPRKPSTVIARGFGDCKDKTQLMIATLKDQGVEAVPVLVMAPADGHVSENLPTLFAFNHVVTGVPWNDRERTPGMRILENTALGPLRLFDATLSGQAADMSVAYGGGAALVVHPETRKLSRIPGSDLADNVWEETYRIDVDAEGHARVRVEVRRNGIWRDELEDSVGRIKQPRELAREFATRFLGRGLDVETLSATDVRIEEDGTWAHDISFSLPDVLAGFGELSVLDIGTFERIEYIPVPDDEPLYLPMKGTRREHVEIGFASREVVSISEPFAVEAPFGKVTLETERDGSTVRIRRELQLTRPRVETDQQEDALAIQDALRRTNAAAVVVGH